MCNIVTKIKIALIASCANCMTKINEKAGINQQALSHMNEQGTAIIQTCIYIDVELIEGYRNLKNMDDSRHTVLIHTA